MPPWNKLEMPQMNQFGLIHTLVGKELFPEDDAEENLSEKYFFLLCSEVVIGYYHEAAHDILVHIYSLSY